MSDTRYVTVGNTTAGPLVIDTAGRIIDGGGFGTVDPDRAPARKLLEDGYLVELDRPDGDDVNPDALAAFDATDARNGGKSAGEVAADTTAAQLEAEADETTTDKPRPPRRRS